MPLPILRTSAPKLALQVLSAAAQPLLRLGTRGQAVRDLQRRLEQKGFELGAQDGVFGPRTEAAVRRFQRANGLVVDGIVGPKTWSSLKKNAPAPIAKPSKPSAPSPKSQGDKILQAAAAVASQRFRYVWGGGHKAKPGASTGIDKKTTVADDDRTKGVDCSGFVRLAVFKATGKDSMNGTAAMQYRKSKPISRSELKPGDLIFFGRPITHVAVYAGKRNGVPMMYESAPSYERKGSSFGTHFSPVAYQPNPTYYGRVR